MLEEERTKHSFNKTQMSYVLHGGKQNYQKVMKLRKLVAQDPVLRFNPEYIQTHRKQMMLEIARKLNRYHELLDFDYFMKFREHQVFADQTPLSLHYLMFVITLNNLCSDKQAKKFYEKAVRGQIIGCYAQTQLAHGSDIQNLMTTATYDIQNQQFILETPSTQATKWWVGDLGVYANHAILFAQLIIQGKRYGLHSFLVPIRDQNHNPYPNIQVGDIGPKYGYHTKDNGFIIFKKYRINRQYMLNRYAKVEVNGQYTRRGNEKISYATMLIVRSLIPFLCAHGLARGVTTLVRYSLVRTQFKDDTGKQIPILDYQLQQEKVIPKIAQAYAFLFGYERILQISKQVFFDAKERGIFDRLNEAHALTSGVKAIFTGDSVRSIQILRRAAGGHGFSMYSGLPHLISQIGSTPTLEGENTILFLQTARYLIKTVQNIQKNKPVPQSVMYLQEINNPESFVANFTSPQPLLILENIRKIFLYNSCQRVKRVGQKIMVALGQGSKMKQVWDYKAGIALVQCGKLHTYYWIFENFLEVIYKSTKNQKVRQALGKLLNLYGIQKILQFSAAFFESGVITSSTLANCQVAKQILLKELRPEALSLVQAFGYTDDQLHSAIGCADGKAYERLFDWVKRYNRVNRPEVLSQIHQQWKKAKSQLRPKL